MSKIYVCFLLFVCVLTAQAQEEFSFKGRVLNFTTQQPLEGAGVFLGYSKDSTKINYTITDKNGFFRLTAKKNDTPVFVKISYLGFQATIEEFKNISNNKDFDTVLLIENTNKLKEVVIQNEVAGVKIKNDTVEFNAASFKVRPDSNVETLLKELPGFEVNADGKMLVNGKEVNQFLVNGKPFFDRDGAILLKNLPAEIINKVQVSDYKTKKEEYAKQESSSDYSSINLTIDEKKNKGFFGKFLGGYGTDDRYETSFVMNYFEGDRKISALGASNNINSNGLSNDEVFDNMGGGRNTSNNQTGSSGRGITTTNLVGLNYTDKFAEKLDGTGNYNFNNAVTENDNRTKQENLLPDGGFLSESNSKTRNESTSNKANLELEYLPKSDIRVFVAPKFNNTRTNSKSDSDSNSKDETGALLNESNTNSYTENETTSFSNSLNFNKTFKRPSRNLSLVLNNNNSNTNGNKWNQSETYFYQSNDPDDIRNQQLISDKNSDSYNAEIEYTEPITDKIRFRIGSEYEWKSSVDGVKTFDFDDATNSYSILNKAQSNYTSSTQNTIRPKAGITYNSEKLRMNLNSETSITQYNNHSDYLNILTDLNKKYLLPNVSAQMRYRFERSKFIVARYRFNNVLPTADQLLPVVDLSNPLNTVIGNANLNPTKSQSVNVDYRNFDFKTRSGFSIYLRGEFIDDDVISATIYDADRKRTTTYRNVSGTYNTSAGGNWSKQIKKENQSFRYGMALNASLRKSKGFTNTVLYDANSLGFTPRAYANYELTDFFTIAPSYGLTYNVTHYNNYTIDKTSNFIHRANLQATTYWPKNWVFGNDFGYTYNSNLSSDFKKDFFLWNASLSYAFFKDQLVAKVKVYDVLNQNQNTTRTITETSIRDEENTILRRYAMFSLTYKIKNFAGTKGNRDFERGDGPPQGPRERGERRNDF
ncbi:outer membrane beta-barrel protein [Flavobacterium agrisoli]|uniref:Outer membrane beta-barrel protein n=1 Tax=Flavobacterium agrisoli TaxID=2793066 RepID=A0A934PQY1_9FLAO|nr:outer membrane beta-barrel protein [Flavobacterium agrisoli]MBK0371023.1 outer membrane beta-barrel protein [Flavobacterium agrisoli]